MADYIDRTALAKKLALLAQRYAEQGRTEAAQDYNWAITVLMAAPTIDITPAKHGRWIPAEFPFEDEYQDCSNCGYKAVWGFRYNYCPKCGARMDGDGNG